MKCVRYHGYGGVATLRLEEVADLQPCGDRPLVRVVCAALNPKDSAIRAGRHKIVSGLRFPKCIGVDYAGTVVTPGAGLAAGQRVFGMLDELRYRRGTLAELVAPDPEEICPLPQAVSFAEAAAAPLVALTALQALRDIAGLQPGQAVLINGGSGGVGTMAIQVARLLQAGQVVTLSSPARVPACARLGAHQALGYEHRDDLLRSGRFDVVFDTFGNLDFAQGRGALRRRGCFVSTAMTPGRVLRDALLRFGAQQERCVSVRARRAGLEQIALWLGSGQLTALASARFPLGSFPDAFALLESGRAYGKVVIDIAAAAATSPV